MTQKDFERTINIMITLMFFEWVMAGLIFISLAFLKAPWLACISAVLIAVSLFTSVYLPLKKIKQINKNRRE